VDLTEIPQARGCKYLLVFVCTFLGWVEAFPTQTEKAWEMARCLLKETIPKFRIPVSGRQGGEWEINDCYSATKEN
jgi:hypothetical protein